MKENVIDTEESFKKLLEFLGCQYLEDMYFEPDHDGTAEEDTKVHNILERLARDQKPVEEWTVMVPRFERPDQKDYYELYEVHGKRFVINRDTGPFTSYAMSMELFKEFKYGKFKILVLVTTNQDMCTDLSIYSDDELGMARAKEHFEVYKKEDYYTEAGLFRVTPNGNGLSVNISTMGSNEYEGDDRIEYYSEL